MIERNIVLKKEGDMFLLPTFEKREVTTSTPVHEEYIMCRTISYDESRGILEVKLEPNSVNENAFRISTEVNSNDFAQFNIQHIRFVGLRTPQVSAGIHLKNDPTIPKDFNELEEALRKLREQHSTTQKQNPEEVIEFSTSLPFEELDFIDGKITFVYRIFKIQQTLTFEIVNPHIKKEFDSIKNFFATVLETPRCALNLRIEVLDGRAISHSATSPHLSQINQSFFSKVEETRLKSISTGENNIGLHDKNEAPIQEEPDIKQDGGIVLDKLLATERTKHYNHLRFLSKKQLANHSLSYTEKPYSFIFLIYHRSTYCAIWETYSTEEATYIWKLRGDNDNMLKQEMEEVVERIKWLRQGNKLDYIASMPIDFYRVQHEYSGDDLGFSKWRETLFSFLGNGATQ